MNCRHHLLLHLTVILGTCAVAVADTRVVPCTTGSPCALSTITPLPGQSIHVQGALQAGTVPVVQLQPLSSAATAADWQLIISRLVLYDVTLDPPTGTSGASKGPKGPLLWPLNAFKFVGTALVLQDVRLVIRSTALFKQYLDFFKAQPALQSDTNTTLHTDGRTFVHVTNWAQGRTTLQSVILLTGPCTVLFDDARAAGQDLTTVLAWENRTDLGSKPAAVALVSSGSSSSGTGCNVFTATNETFVPLLLDQGRLSSREQMLVLLQSNASLGSQYTQPGHIDLGRPVALAGLWSVPTGIDFMMVPNTLNVTAPLARIAFSSLILENNPTGDVTTTLVSAPFSPIASVNLYAVFCNRAISSKPCTVLNNVTLVLSSQTEFDYVGYMYTMFNSQAPGARQLTLFYTQDLLFTVLNFTVGPGSDSITVNEATSVSWRMLNTVYTTQPRLFKPLPLPHHTYIDFETSKAAPLALQVFNCADLKAALSYRTIPSRLHVLLIRKNISLAATNGPQVSSITPPPTDDLRFAVDGPSTINMTEWPVQYPGPSCLGDRPFVTYRTQLQGLLHDQPIMLKMPEVDSSGGVVHPGFASLAFSYVRNGLVMPSEQPGQLTIQNLVLRGLPQGGSPSELAAAAQLPYRLPPEAWTCLIWAVNSSLTERALNIKNSALEVPEPEFKHLATLARLRKAFVVELANHPDALTFKDVTEHAQHLHVSWFEGPGIMGENVTFILALEAQPSLTRLGGYWWPSNYVPVVAEQRLMAGDGQPGRSGSISTLLPAVLVPVVVALIAVALVAALLLRRRHQKQLDQLRYQVYEAGVSSQDSRMSDKPPGGGTTEPGSLSHSMLGSSRRSSREGGSKPAGSSCAMSITESGDLHVDMEHIHMLQAGVPYHSGSALQDRLSALSPVQGHTPLQSPHGEHRVRFHGFCPVIEGVPAPSSSVSGLHVPLQMPLPPGSRCASSSSSSSHGRVLTSRGHELAKAMSSLGSSSGSQPPSRQGAASRPAAAASSAAAASPAPEVCGGSLATTVATGLENWRIAVSTTTRQLAERRLAEQQALSVSRLHHSVSITPPKGRLLGEALPTTPASFSSSCCQEPPGAQPSDRQLRQQRQDAQQQQQQGDDAAARQPQDNSERSAAADSGTSLVLKRVLGRGSFGQVWLGTWRGILVAVKIMHLPLNVLVDQKDTKQQQQPGQQQPDRQETDRQQPDQQQLEQEQQQASSQEAGIEAPHFAIMEAVLSSQCSHPNVVQVYTYMLTPLLTAAQPSNRDAQGADDSMAACAAAPAQQSGVFPTVVGEPGCASKAADVAAAASAAAAAAAAQSSATLSGWELKLIMEYCDEGTLRSALDRGMFKPRTAHYKEPKVAALLARDVAAAMLHLHSEGVVHGDLKAANVMLAGAGPDPHGLWHATLGRRIVAKVADFGLAVSLGPSETHASLTARGTPTHMSPELFMAGRVSKASDVYAFGMLLYELVSGQRAFTGVPLPLLPHEVAVKGLRPVWPSDLPPAFWPLRRLAEACWDQDPDQRPVFTQILEALDHWLDGDVAYHPAWLGSCASTSAAAAQQAQQLPQQADQRPAVQPQHTVQQVKCVVPDELLQPPPQQQHRQWRDTVQHASPHPHPEPESSNVAGRGIGLQPRTATGQMDWSEVSFECLRHGNEP